MVKQPRITMQRLLRKLRAFTKEIREMMNNDRGRGGTGPKKPNVTVDRYGISPQLAPPRLTAMDKECLNSDIVATPQKSSAKPMGSRY